MIIYSILGGCVDRLGAGAEEVAGQAGGAEQGAGAGAGAGALQSTGPPQLPLLLLHQARVQVQNIKVMIPNIRRNFKKSILCLDILILTK